MFLAEDDISFVMDSRLWISNDPGAVITRRLEYVFLEVYGTLGDELTIFPSF
jgi:hypothetical protein